MRLIKKKLAFITVFAALAAIAVITGGCSNEKADVGLSGAISDGPGEDVSAVQIGDSELVEVSGVAEALSQADAEENRDKDVTVYFGEDYKGAGSINPSDRTGKLTYNLQGHTIGRDNTDFVNSGEMFSLNHAADVTICNGSISGCKSKNNGGAIWVDGDQVKLTLDGVTITGNETKQYGGGVFADGCDAMITIKDTTIQSNKSPKFGGGIYAAYEHDKQAQVIFQGVTVIKGNNGTAENDDAVFARKGDKYTPADISGLIEGAEISFAFSTRDPGSFNIILEGENGSITADDACNYLVSNNTRATIQNDGGKLSFVPNDKCLATVTDDRGTFYYSSFEDSWKHAVTKIDCDVTIKLYQDWTASDGWFGNKGTPGFKQGQFYPLKRTTQLTFDLNGHTLDAALKEAQGDGRIFYFDEDCKIIIKNGRLTGAYCTNGGGAIYLNDKDVVLCLDNLAITGNKSKTNGSAIFFNRGCSVTLRQVTITENTTAGFYSKGAVFYKGGYLTLEGVVKIYDNPSADNPFSDLFIYNEPEEIDCQKLSSGSRICVSQEYNETNCLTKPADNIEEIKSCFSPAEKSGTKLTVSDNSIQIQGGRYSN